MAWFNITSAFYVIFLGERGDDGAIGLDGDIGVPGLKGFAGPIGPEGNK